MKVELFNQNAGNMAYSALNLVYSERILHSNADVCLFVEISPNLRYFTFNTKFQFHFTKISQL